MDATQILGGCKHLGLGRQVARLPVMAGMAALAGNPAAAAAFQNAFAPDAGLTSRLAGAWREHELLLACGLSSALEVSSLLIPKVSISPSIARTLV